MGLTSAVDWWEESQLRFLVLGSLMVQWLLFLSSMCRRIAIPWWFRSMVWLAYMGSDALAIYALATLFNLKRNQDRSFSSGGISVLEVMSSPILLIHLGGQDFITAYNIEDNELWVRHVLTAVSQVTVAIYVSYKSWEGGDKKILVAVILLFVVGIIKCLEKPWALKKASINSLVNSSRPAQRTAIKEGEINTLEDFVQEAKTFVQNVGSYQAPKGSQETVIGNIYLLIFGDFDPFNNMFADLASPLPQRLRILKCCWVQETRVYRLLQVGISGAFGFLYTKQGMFRAPLKIRSSACWTFFSIMGIRNLRGYVPWVAFFLLHKSHRDAYDHNDVKITYVLLCCTAVLESCSSNVAYIAGLLSWPNTVSQYSIIELFARTKNHAKKMCIVSFFGFKDYLDQHWCMKSCSSSDKITKAVLQHVKDGWNIYIRDVASYRMFNDLRGQWTLERKGFSQLCWSLNRPFDESVLLWHLATELCWFSSVEFAWDSQHAVPKVNIPIWLAFLKLIWRPSIIEDRFQETYSVHGRDQRSVNSKQMSNYMMYLLLVNPEMLLTGSRRNLFTAAYEELKVILKEIKPPLEETGLTKRIILELKSTEGSQEGFIHDAWVLAKALLDLSKREMWEVIEGVWVEMLCFSASRCRGYLHAKALGTGGELLTYVWLLLSNMGMETLAERLQRTELPSGEVSAGAASSTSEVRTGGAAPSSPSKIAASSTSGVPTGAAPSTSESRIAAEEDMV